MFYNLRKKISSKTMTDERIADRCRELAALINHHTIGDGFQQTSIAPLGFTRESLTGTMLHSVSTPMLAIVVQGKKGAALGEEIYRYGEAQYLVVSVDQPISGFIIEATPDRPFLGFKLDLDPRELCEIIAVQTTAIAGKKETSVRGFFVSTADLSLLDCTLRLIRLLDTP